MLVGLSTNSSYYVSLGLTAVITNFKPKLCGSQEFSSMYIDSLANIKTHRLSHILLIIYVQSTDKALVLIAASIYVSFYLQ